MQQSTIDPLTLIKQSLAVYKCTYIACENTFHTSVAHITYVQTLENHLSEKFLFFTFRYLHVIEINKNKS